MKPSEIYLRAAEMVDRGDAEFSCVAVSRVVGLHRPDERREYNKMFSNRRRGAWGHYFGSDDEERKSGRVLALLFMSEIAKDSE